MNAQYSTDIQEQFQQEEKVAILIQLENQESKPNTKGLLKEEKAFIMFDYLQEQARVTQGPLLSYLDSQNIHYQAFWVSNAIAATVTYEQYEYIKTNFNPASMGWDQAIMVSSVRESSGTRMEPEWGIQMINADLVWEMGIKGQGVVMAGQDTGYDFENSLILPRYRGYNDGVYDHNHNWHDAIREINPLHGDTLIDENTNPCGLDLDMPCDDHGHGTHTMGTMVGEDSENLIGVAPEASWIACRNMERGYGSPSTYLECYQFFLAPTDIEGNNPDPSKAPHVINNSWSCPVMEGCNLDNFHVLEEAVNNLVQAGTVVVVSAGNSGSSNCSSINTPSAIFQESFTVGATAINDSITGFSSIGPVAVDESNRMKPDVVAPGAGIRSIHLNDEFRTWSGTSMAGPHVAGAVALLIAANPNLAGDVTTIRDILTISAVKKTGDLDCWNAAADALPNHIYGHGRIDVFEAVNIALTLSNTENSFEDNTVLVRPNPAHDQVQFSCKDNILRIQITDASGQSIRTIKDIDQGIIQVPLLDYLPGIYFYELHTKTDIFTGKLVKW